MITAYELTAIKELLHYVQDDAVFTELAVDVVVSDSNGEVLGVITRDQGEYVLDVSRHGEVAP